MKRGILLLVFSLLSSKPAQASFLEFCTFRVKVESIKRVAEWNAVSVFEPGEPGIPAQNSYRRLVTVLILDSQITAGKSSHTNCNYNGETRDLHLRNDDSLQLGQELKVDYGRANSFTPAGLAESEFWQVQKD